MVVLSGIWGVTGVVGFRGVSMVWGLVGSRRCGEELGVLYWCGVGLWRGWGGGVQWCGGGLWGFSGGGLREGGPRGCGGGLGEGGGGFSGVVLDYGEGGGGGSVVWWWTMGVQWCGAG